MKRTSAPPLPPRVPYPQTPETARQWMVAHGVTVTDLARLNQVPRSTLVDLRLHLEQVAYHHHNVAAYATPELEFGA